MRNKFIAILLASAMVLSGCAGKGAEQAVIPEQTTLPEQSEQPEVVQEEPVTEESVVYDLKPVETAEVSAQEEVAEQSDTSSATEISTDSEPVEDDSITSEETVEQSTPTLSSESTTSSDSEPQMTQEDINAADLSAKLSMPEEFVMNMSIGVEGAPIPISVLMGESGDYQLVGTEAMFMWESDNGTFIKNSDGVFKVDVEGRSVMFTEDEEDSDSSDELLSDDSLGIDTEDPTSMLEDSQNIKYIGTQEFNGKKCHVFDFSIKDDTGAEQVAQMYVDADSYVLRGLSVEESGMSLTFVVHDYKEFVSRLEAEVSGTMSDKEASEATENALMMTILSVFGMAMSGSDMSKSGVTVVE